MSRAMYAVPRERTPFPAPGSQTRCNIPTQATSLVGRKSLIADACSTLRNADVHWLTMSGPPGVGKTRLALGVGSSMSHHFVGGVYFVPLASVTEPDLVLSCIAQALHLKEARQRPLLDRLKRCLGDSQSLLILDNLEQVTEAASIVSELLEVCPHLKVLATSRTLLHLYGEHDLPVPPLSLPELDAYSDLDSLLQSESVALFVQRAQAGRPDFRLTKANAQPVAEICLHLEGLPLAIELAAARVRLLPPQAILPRVAHRLPFLQGGALNLPPRQRTLHGAVEWSYDLLHADEQHLFRHFAVFAGGATLDAIVNCAPHTINEHDPNGDVLDLVASLIDKSLLRQADGIGGEPRYVMLEMVREYALEKLDESEETDVVRHRHALYFLDLAEQLNIELQGPNQALCLDRLAEEHDNFRAALEWSSSTEDRRPRDASNLRLGTIALRLASALHPFWEMRGQVCEGRARLAAALRGAGAEADVEAHAQALFAAGRMALLQRDDEAAEPLVVQSLDLHRQLRHKLGTSCALVTLGHLAIRRGDDLRAGELYEEAFILRTEIGDPLWISRSLAGLAYLAHYRGDYERATELHEQSLVLTREVGDKNAVGAALVRLAYELACREQYRRADSLLREGAEIYTDLGSSQGIADCLAINGKIAFALAQSERAVVQFGLARSLFDAVGVRMEPPTHSDPAEYEQAVEALKIMLGDEVFAALWDRAQKMPPEEVALFGSGEQPAVAPTNPATCNGHQASYPFSLTPREVEVLRLVAAGMTNIEAADRLTVSRHTINMHLRSIYSKLEVTSRIAAARIAIAHGLV